MQELSSNDLATWLADQARPAPVLLDVREDWEWDIAHIDGARHLPMGRIPGNLASIDPEQPLVCICHHGVRSRQVALFLEHHGCSSVYNLTGGIAAWAAIVDPKMRTY